MNAYSIMYPWAVMILAVLAAIICVIGGSITAYLICLMPVKEQTGDSRVGNIFFGFFVFVISCLGSQLCLYIGGKAIGAF